MSIDPQKNVRRPNVFIRFHSERSLGLAADALQISLLTTTFGRFCRMLKISIVKSVVNVISDSTPADVNFIIPYNIQHRHGPFGQLQAREITAFRKFFWLFVRRSSKTWTINSVADRILTSDNI